MLRFCFLFLFTFNRKWNILTPTDYAECPVLIFMGASLVKAELFHLDRQRDERARIMSLTVAF